MVKKGLLILFALILCGCTKDKYSNYEKFDLKGKEAAYYEYHPDGYEIDRYALTDITKEKYGDTYEGRVHGLLYQTETGEYILIDEIQSCGGEGVTDDTRNNQIFGNKLYIARCTGGYLLEYTLDKENFSVRDLRLDLSSIKDAEKRRLHAYDFEKITENEIYFNASDNVGKKEIIKCSKDSLKCTLENE